MNIDQVTSSCLPTVSTFIRSDKSLVKLSSPRTSNSLPDIQGHQTGTPHRCQTALRSSSGLWQQSPGLRHGITGACREVPPIPGGWCSPPSHPVPCSPSSSCLVCWTPLKFSMWHLFWKKEVWEIRYFRHLHLTFVRLHCASLKIPFPLLPS